MRKRIEIDDNNEDLELELLVGHRQCFSLSVYVCVH